MKISKFNSKTIEEIKECILNAGILTLKYHNNLNTHEIKEDLSPLTKADLESHYYLEKNLKKIINVPVLSEEHYIDYHIRKTWGEFWLIDPLDGTKEFITGHDDYCINIAFIRNNSPVFGMIYAPKLNELYFASVEIGFNYEGKPINQSCSPDGIQMAVSRFHHSEKTQVFIENNNIKFTHPIGAAIKFGRMALGLIQIYPRFEGSKEWDTAAGQIIISTTGCKLLDLTTKKNMLYNKPNIKNNFFFAYNSSLDFNQFKL
jgi:3'(2'), 5'-bisphosphate nucleotidase